MDTGLSLLLILPMLLVMSFVYFVIFHRMDLKCPHCHAKIEGTGHSSFVRLGAPLLSCPYCGREFFDPFRMEWAAHAAWYRILTRRFSRPAFLSPCRSRSPRRCSQDNTASFLLSRPR